MRFVDAVCASNLPSDIRHLLMVMAYKADNETGRGWTGQQKLGAAIGCNDRSVRSKLERLETIPDSPVRVERRYRTSADGRGRTSDEYHLVIQTNRQPAAAETAPTRNALPVKRPHVSGDQPAAERRPTGSPMHDQPAAGCQGSSQIDPLSYPLSISARSARGVSRPKPVKAKAPNPKQKREHTPEQKQAHAELTAHYFADFERLRGSKPIGWGAKEGKAVWTLLEKLKFDGDAARRIVTSGLQSWAKATIMTISADPSACVAATGLRPAHSNRGGDFADELALRAQRLTAEERARA
jgi:hypothetical protein